MSMPAEPALGRMTRRPCFPIPTRTGARRLLLVVSQWRPFTESNFRIGRQIEDGWPTNEGEPWDHAAGQGADQPPFFRCRSNVLYPMPKGCDRTEKPVGLSRPRQTGWSVANVLPFPSDAHGFGRNLRLPRVRAATGSANGNPSGIRLPYSIGMGMSTPHR